VIECQGVQILGANAEHDVSSHAVYLDRLLLGRFDGDRAVFKVLPALEAGVHRVAIHVSSFPGVGLCDDFTLRRVVFSCK
jgi:hypothetical protein